MKNKLLSYFQMCAHEEASDIFIRVDRPVALRKTGNIQNISDHTLQEDDVHQFLIEQLDEKQQIAFEQTGDLDMGYTLPSGERFRLNMKQQGHSAVLVVWSRLKSLLYRP